MKSLLSLKKLVKSPVCQWCKSSEIKLVPVSSLVNLKPGEIPKYRKLWQKQGWPTNLYLCWVCRLNCELAKQGVNVWLCPKCRKVFVYGLEKLVKEVPTYNQLPVNCNCGWKKKRLSKREQQKIADQTIKSGLVYRKDQKTAQKSYLAQCSFCNEIIEAQKRKKEVKNRNKVRFWTDKASEERLVCNKYLRGNGEFQKLLLEKYRGRWRVYKSRGLV